MKPRLVASDLDGTLLRDDGTVSERTARIWQALPDVGVETVVVTARPPRWLNHLEGLIGAHGMAICGNGAFVYDVAARTVLEAEGFTPEAAGDLVERILRAYPQAGAAVETDLGMFRTSAYPDPHAGLAAHGEDSGDDVTDCELDAVPAHAVIGKILIADPTWRDDHFIENLQSILAADGVLAYSGAAGLAEISAPGVTKAQRLERWCAQRGIAAHEVWAFGDMPNDIPMLRWAGRGIAVDNAHAELLAIADDVCPTNERDGVATVLERLIDRS